MKALTKCAANTNAFRVLAPGNLQAVCAVVSPTCPLVRLPTRLATHVSVHFQCYDCFCCQKKSIEGVVVGTAGISSQIQRTNGKRKPSPRPRRLARRCVLLTLLLTVVNVNESNLAFPRPFQRKPQSQSTDRRDGTVTFESFVRSFVRSQRSFVRSKSPF